MQIGGGGLDVDSFTAWAALCDEVPTIAVNNGYCFAGNAALFGCADITIATRSSWIGMAGPAMIEGGGLGDQGQGIGCTEQRSLQSRSHHAPNRRLPARFPV